MNLRFVGLSQSNHQDAAMPLVPMFAEPFIRRDQNSLLSLSQ